MTWIVKTSKGQIKGPYTTQEIIKNIEDGFINGEEEIAQYPSGQFQAITKEKLFYEKILEQLELQGSSEVQNSSAKEEDKKHEKKAESSANTSEETVIIPFEKSQFKTKLTKALKPIEKIEAGDPGKKKKLTPEEIRKIKEELKPEVIELQNITQEKIKKNTETLKLPFILFGAVLVVGLMYFFFLEESPENEGTKIRLLSPKKNINQLNAQQIEQRTQQALRLIASDTTENYLAAQNILVDTIENSLNNLKPRMILCEVYKELWNYSYQDTQDMKTVSNLAKSTKSLNKIETSGFFCEAVKLYTESRFKEALNTIDTILSTDYSNFLLYQFKGELLELEKDNLIAESFFQKSRELSGQWIKPVFSQGMINLKLKEFSKASAFFVQALNENPKHKASLFALGILEFYRNQYDKALNYLKSGLENKSKIDKSLESNGLEALSEIYLIKGNKSKALEIANLNLQKNPSKKSAVELCHRLGGCDQSLSSHSKPDEELLFNCQSLLRQKDYLPAQAECKAAFELNNLNSTAALKASEALWNLGQGLEAIDWVNKAIKADPKNVKAYLKKSEFLIQRYDFNESEKTLFQADYLSKGNYEIQKGFAYLAFKKKDWQGTMKLAERALKIYDSDIESIILYSSAARELAKLTIVTNQKDQEKRIKFANEAFNYALKAVELDSTNVEAHVNYAKIISTRQGVDNGIDYLQELINKYPSIYDYRISLGEILMEEDRYKPAADIIDKVLALNESNKKAFMLGGRCYYQLGQIDKAIGYFLKASFLDPSDAEPIFEVARIYLETSRITEAKNQLERVINLNTKFPRAHLFLGRAHLMNGNFVEAEKNAEIEKKNYPGLIDSYLLVGEIKFASKNYSECASEYARATNVGAQPVYVYVRAARCYRLSGQIDMAQGFLDIAAERESGFEDIYKEQGALFEARGDRAAAIRSYCKYLELSPNAKDKDEFLKQIRIIGGDCGD